MKEILIKLIEDSASKEELLTKLIQNFSKIQEGELYKGLLYIFGTYINDKDLIIQAIDKIRISLGSLPLVKSVPVEHKEINPETTVKKI